LAPCFKGSHHFFHYLSNGKILPPDEVMINLLHNTAPTQHSYEPTSLKNVDASLAYSGDLKAKSTLKVSQQL
jgi:hypothetical protein